MRWQEAIEREWNVRNQEATPRYRFPLMGHAFEVRDIIAATDALLSGRLTSAERVREFERRFAQLVGAPYAVMLNSGSSANLLAVAASCNPVRGERLKRGDEVLVPAVCWSTSVAPLLQFGLVPVLVDVDPETLNMSIADARRRLTSRTRAIMAVHILGNSCPMHELLELASERNLLLIEDTCESLSSRAKGKALGTFGAFGTFSFYYSHHITSGEGGMIVCRDQADYELLKCLRAHGWSRELSDRGRLDETHPDVDPRFLFVNAGFNMRPVEMQAAIALQQLERLPAMNEGRISNRARLLATLRNHHSWNGQLTFPMAAPGTEPVWFGFAAFLERGRDRAAFLRTLDAHGVENRPIVSGNFARQPLLHLFGVDADPKSFPGAEEVHHRGFFIGLQNDRLQDAEIADLADILLTT